jgi:hypothetical protein
MIWLLLACAEPEPVVDTCDNPGDTTVYVMDRLLLAREVDGVVAGFNLDGQDFDSCGLGDYVDAEGTPGIDNAFTRLIPALETTEAAQVEDVVFEAINNGSLLLTAELEASDDLWDDGCVNLVVGQAEGEPRVGTHGSLLAGQTFDRHATAPSARADGVVVQDGRVLGTGMDLALPIEILGTPLEFTMIGGALQLDMDPETDTATGVMGGSINVDDLLDLVSDNGIADEVAEVLTGLLDVAADMDPDGDGECRHLSVAFEFTAVNAYFYEESALE